jgi:hypothetical protein
MQIRTGGFNEMPGISGGAGAGDLQFGFGAFLSGSGLAEFINPFKIGLDALSLTKQNYVDSINLDRILDGVTLEAAITNWLDDSTKIKLGGEVAVKFDGSVLYSLGLGITQKIRDGKAGFGVSYNSSQSGKSNLNICGTLEL